MRLLQHWSCLEERSCCFSKREQMPSRSTPEGESFPHMAVQGGCTLLWLSQAMPTNLGRRNWPLKTFKSKAKSDGRLAAAVSIFATRKEISWNWQLPVSGHFRRLRLLQISNS